MSLTTLLVTLLSAFVGAAAAGMLLARWLMANSKRRRYAEGFLRAINAHFEANPRAWWIFGSLCWATAIIVVAAAIWSLR